MGITNSTEESMPERLLNESFTNRSKAILMQMASMSFAAMTLTTLVSLPSTTAKGQDTFAITNARIETATKDGVIESGTLVVKDKKIIAVGKDAKIPLDAAIINAKGSTIVPGIVDPYFVVSIGRNVQSTPARTIVFNGRTFVIGGGTTRIATTFAKVADGLDTESVDWKPALRSGITTMHLTTGGFAQSAIAQPGPSEQTEFGVEIVQRDGLLVSTASNETSSLEVLRKGLAKKASSGGTPVRGRPTPEQMAAMRARMMGARGSTPPSSSSAASSNSSANPVDQLWESVKAGKQSLFVNVDNASSVLHVQQIAKGQEKAKIALIVSGANAFLNLETLPDGNYTLVLPPRIDLKPNSATRVNVPALLANNKIPFCFSLSLGQSDFRAMQHNPFFALGMLVKTGLDRELALKALTAEPAKLIGMEDQIGTIAEGKQASFLILDGDPFAATTEIEAVYSRGARIDDEI
ncbi:MAG: amidohydrolase family protein [Aureliella sp.]